MEQIIAITSKWQIHIPLKIRQDLNWTKPSLVKISAQKQKIILQPQPSQILKLAGKFSHKKPVRKINLEKIRDFIDYSQL